MKTSETAGRRAAAAAAVAAPPADDALTSLLTDLHALLDRLTAFRQWDQVSQPTALVASGRLGSARARIESAMVASAERVRSTTARSGGSPGAVGSMLAGQFGGDRREGNALVHLAKQLAAAPAIGDSLAAGRVSKEQAQVIARGLSALPPSVSEADRARAERELLTAAPKMSLPDLARRATRMREACESVHDADVHENEQLVAREQSAWEQSMFWMKEVKPGLVKGGFLLPEVQAQMLQAAVEAISAPRRFHLMDAGVAKLPEPAGSQPPEWAFSGTGSGLDSGTGSAAAHGSDLCSSNSGAGVGSARPGGPEDQGGPAHPGAAAHPSGSAHRGGWARTIDQLDADLDATEAAEADGLPLDKQHREGRALAQLCEHLPTDRLPGVGGVSAILTVNLDLDTLTHGVRAATLSTGGRMSAGEVRRLACNARLIPQVFDGASLPLDLGRAKRLFTVHQRRAIENRDGGCVFPGCDRPPGWCEGHHWRQPWSTGGTTDLANLILVCGSHHRRIHLEDLSVRMREGRVEVHTRPPDGGPKNWLSNQRFRVPPNAH